MTLVPIDLTYLVLLEQAGNDWVWVAQGVEKDVVVWAQRREDLPSFFRDAVLKNVAAGELLGQEPLVYHQPIGGERLQRAQRTAMERGECKMLVQLERTPEGLMVHWSVPTVS